MKSFEPFGNHITFSEPSWYQNNNPTPYYNESHVDFRQKVREFIEKDFKPHLDKYLENGQYDLMKTHTRLYELGIVGATYRKIPEFAEKFDTFHEVIFWDEIARMGVNGALGQIGINSMALPPIIEGLNNEDLRQDIIDSVVQGRKNVSLLISEPTAGSDVSNIKCVAKRDGDNFIVSGQKKWITGGLLADYYVTAVRTKNSNTDDKISKMMSLSLLVIPSDLPGISKRKMTTQFDSINNTSFIDFNNVIVPSKYLIGEENNGFMYIMHNFNHERLIISIGAIRGARLCYEKSIEYASLKRKTFGKRLIDHQLIRFKLAEMARQIEAVFSLLETVANFFNFKTDGELGEHCALLKVQASKTFEFCAREASQIFGGAAVVREGVGADIERLYRDVRSSAIPGGSEEVLLDYAIRSIVSKI